MEKACCECVSSPLCLLACLISSGITTLSSSSSTQMCLQVSSQRYSRALWQTFAALQSHIAESRAALSALVLKLNSPLHFSAWPINSWCNITNNLPTSQMRSHGGCVQERTKWATRGLQSSVFFHNHSVTLLLFLNASPHTCISCSVTSPEYCVHFCVVMCVSGICNRFRSQVQIWK